MGALSSSFLRTRTIFSSSAISPALFCSRPAVSISTTSAPGRARGQRIEGEPAASAPAARAITSAPVRVAPDLQLLDGGGAERIARGQHDLEPSPQALGDLADGRGLAGAVDAGDQHHEGLLLRSMANGFSTGLSSPAISPASMARNSSFGNSLS
jgi:hypothetical protein